MAQPFKDLTRAAVRKKLPARPDYADELDDFLDGNLWRNGKGWIGELPASADALLAMARGIVGEGVVAEVVRRAAGGVLGKEPRWRLVSADTPIRPRRRAQPATPAPTPAPEPGATPPDPATDPAPTTTGNDPAAPVDAPDEAYLEIEDALTTWWDRRNILAVLQQAVRQKAAEGRGPLYCFIPPGLRDENGEIPRCATLEEALGYIYIDAREPSEAGVHIDKATRMHLGIVLGRDEKNRETVDVSYLDESGLTVLDILSSEVRQVDAEPWRVDLGGQLFVHDSLCEPVVSRQVIQAQKAITLTLSQLMRNVNLAGHRQVDYLNAQPPGEDVPAQAGEAGAVEISPGVWRKYVARPIPTGPSVRNFVQGNEIRDEEGKLIGYTNPNVATVEPASVDHFERTYHIFRASALQQCNQAHVLGTEAAQSGISREQARADFETSLGPLKSAMDDAGRWLLGVTLHLAAHLMQQPGLFAGIRPEFDCILNTGPLTTGEQEQVRSNVDAKLISRERAMSQLGVDDVAAERERIKQEAEEGMVRAQAAGLTPAVPATPAPTAPATAPAPGGEGGSQQ